VARFTILSGPSCVGKGPLYGAVRRFYPHLAQRLAQCVLYNSRDPRPGERDGVDYHFRSRTEVEDLRNRAAFSVFEVRADLQAIDTQELSAALAKSDVLFEGNPFVGAHLLEFARAHGFACLSVFLSPLAHDEVVELTAKRPHLDMADFITDVMRRKLLRRTARQKGILSIRDLEDIEIRAASAYVEMQESWRFDHVIVNHDGEDSEHWDAFYYPIGDARRSLKAFAHLLADEPSCNVEKWEQGVLP